MLWGDKPYYSLNYYLKKMYGHKVYKLALDAGFTCPNRDGLIDTRGCIFCSSGGSGEFAQSKNLSITEQIEKGKKFLQDKYKGKLFIAYFQAFTNTYGTMKKLNKVYSEAINCKDIIGLSIATRPDCINDDIASLLGKINKDKKVWVELGLQTIHKKSSEYIRRGYPLSCFEDAVSLLNRYNIDIIVHLIIGLPGESHDDIIHTIDYIKQCNINGVKLQLLHVLKDTDLENHYNNNEFKVLSREEYITTVVDCIERLPHHFVIHRITGDGPQNLLIAPKWSTDKKRVMNDILKEFKRRQSYQGKFIK